MANSTLKKQGVLLKTYTVNADLYGQFSLQSPWEETLNVYASSPKDIYLSKTDSASGARAMKLEQKSVEGGNTLGFYNGSLTIKQAIFLGGGKALPLRIARRCAA